MRWPFAVAAFLALGIAASPLSARADDLSPYMEKCKEAGVPLPPKWPDAKWTQRKPDLPKEKVFDPDPKFDTPVTEVFVYETDLGICYALPRKSKDGEILLLGIICQGKKSGKACFWDNVKPGTSEKIQGKDLKLDPAKIGDGSNLLENCTECHRGDNAFNITPGTALDLDRKADGARDPKKMDRTDRKGEVDTPPFTPLGHDGWENPMRPGDDPLSYRGEGCAFCHAIPKMTKLYCGMVNRMINRHVMPPSGKPDADEKQDIDEIKKECKKRGYVWED